MNASENQDSAREAWRLLTGLVYPPRFLAIARKLGLTPPILGAVHCLEQPRTMGDLAEFLHCDPSNVTGIVDGLEAKGLARRRPSERDRRVKLVELTAQGKSLRGRLERKMQEAPAWIEELSATDQRALLRILRKAAAASE